MLSEDHLKKDRNINNEQKKFITQKKRATKEEKMFNANFDLFFINGLICMFYLSE